MFGKQKLDNLSVEELEKVLLVKRRQARLARFEKLAQKGRAGRAAFTEATFEQPSVPRPQPAGQTPALPRPSIFSKFLKKNKKRPGTPPIEKTRSKKIIDVVLLGLEVVAVVGLVGVLVASYFNLKELNDEVSLAQQAIVEKETATPVQNVEPPIAVAQLPGGHSPPTSPGGAVPDIPPHLQQWVQPGSDLAAAGAIQVEPQNSSGPTRIVIPKIKVNAPIVSGVTWEDLKKGVGHLPGSANPGERGNLYLAAHNDIYGEIFRYLEELEVGDEYFIYAGDEEFRYVVQEKRVIEPTEVDVMLPTTEPVATLQTCYPYLVDSHRLIVIGELAE
jgi:sortase A